MARKRTGTVGKTKDGRLQAIITLADGTRKRMPPFKRGTSEAMAREKAAYYAEQALVQNLTKPIPPDELTGGELWWDRYFAYRTGRGLSPVGHLYRPHIKPVLGSKHPKDWTPEDCAALVSALDAKIVSSGKDKISWKTAANAWSLFTTACKVACSAKDQTGLRVRKDNPCSGIEGPERGESKAKQWIYPLEFLKLAECALVPLRFRRLYALLAYTYLRPGELKALEWRDVDLDVGTIHVTKSWDYKQKRIKPPKTRAGVRYVPIEPTLLPLLRTMRDESGGASAVGPVSWLPPVEDWAQKFRRDLRRAGLTRAELFDNTATHKHITLYDLRATGITWRCLRKDYGPEIQQAAGHEKYDTTDGYVRTARVFFGRVGNPFPALPAALLGANRSPNRSPNTQVVDIVATPAGIEPALPA